VDDAAPDRRPPPPQRHSTSVSVLRTFDAPVHEVFRAWTTPEALAAWAWGSWGPHVEAFVDLRVGGLYGVHAIGDEADATATAVEDPSGGPFGVYGLYVEIVPHERLVYTQHWDADVGYNRLGAVVVDEIIVVDFTPLEDGRTEVRFLQLGVPDDGVSAPEHEAGVLDTFAHLARWLEAT
jgi:uncharacterized protein YndB with AHSA1/START domain